MLWPKRNSYKEVDNEKNSCGLKIPQPPPPPSPLPITFLMVPPKKSNRFDKQNNFARVSRFFLHFLAVTERL